MRVGAARRSSVAWHAYRSSFVAPGSLRVAVSNAAAVVGEVLSLELMGGGQTVMVKVCVRDSRPVIIDGTVRHRVRLGLIDLQSTATLPEDAVADPLAIESTIQRVAEAG